MTIHIGHIYYMLNTVLDKYTKNEELSNNEVTVSELVRCLRRSYFDRNSWILQIGLSAFRGIAMHKLLLETFVEKFGGEMEYVVKKEYNGITIRGTIDYINKDEDFLVEVKTSNYHKILNRYIYQAKMYMYLSGVSRAFVLLLTNTDAYVADIPYDPNIEDIILKRATELHNALVNNIPPNSTSIDPFESECHFCQYLHECLKSKEATLEFNDKL